ncbi:c-type cytochrome domain-containing protein [Emticicia sp. TH156]|uniref:c-type cytochrome domain-containing protein n=1 Tax=Emticicia sp. TH156 TaxID=2067454 RepID=UPI000C76E204|nr:c-type cytochrome domain-containing protein [Emticicia sp. TH156]PLK43589.1 ribonuclease inhibitor [Emticicia sp. TH156]
MALLTVSDWAAFFGRFHPLLVHLPIGFLLIAGVFELLKITGRLSISLEVMQSILLLSAIGATMACVAGYFLSLEGGYEADMLEEHKMQGIWLAVFCWLAWLAKNRWVNERVGLSSILYLPALVLSLLLMIAAGHHGGNLTHGETYLTENTPQPMRGWLGMPDKKERVQENEEKKSKIKNIQEALVYQDIIKPIFKQKCESCHNANKMKGDLRMDEIELLKKGGKHGNIFVEGNTDKSEFIKRIILPESDDDHMPPKGKTQITEDELALLKWWIEQGATFDKRVREVQTPETIKPILAKLGSGAGGASSADKVPQDKFEVEDKLLNESVDKLDEGSAQAIKKTGALILPFAQNNNYLEISFINKPKLTDNEVSVITKAKDQTLWLKLSNTQITDIALAEVAKLTKLTRLHLENTKVTDNGLYQLNPLTSLEYLNLTGNKISDSGLKNLKTLINLKKLYLWKTEVTPKGAEELRKSLPKLQIELGMTEAQIADFLKAKPNEVSDDLYKKK